jgi:predicted Holliday junction resolvase-like endonuclease
MTIFLALIIVLFFGLIIYLIVKINTDRLNFQSRVKYLEGIIQQLCEEQEVRNNQLQLSEELKQKLLHINSTLNKEIYDLNFKLFEGLFSKK